MSSLREGGPMLGMFLCWATVFPIVLRKSLVFIPISLLGTCLVCGQNSICFWLDNQHVSPFSVFLVYAVSLWIQQNRLWHRRNHINRQSWPSWEKAAVWPVLCNFLTCIALPVICGLSFVQILELVSITLGTWPMLSQSLTTMTFLKSEQDRVLPIVPGTP